MKAVCFEYSFCKKGNNKKPYFYLKPETAFLLNNRPFFIPDYSNDIRIQHFIAVKICKIGKYISPKFAFDYFDAVTAGICFTAYDLYNNSIENGISHDIARNFDFSTPIGKFIPKSDFEDFGKINTALNNSKSDISTIIIEQMHPDFNEMISSASRFVSLKIGDIIMATTEISSEPVNINERFYVTLNDAPVLTVEIK